MRARLGALVLVLASGALACVGSRPAQGPTPPTAPEPVVVVDEPVEPPAEPVPEIAPPPVESSTETTAPREDEEILVRVGLVSDLDRYELGCCDGRIHLQMLQMLQMVQPGGASEVLTGPLTVMPASRSVTPPVYRLQAAALRDEGEAERLAADLARRTGWPGDVGFDAESGLYRVRLGRFVERSAADEARRRVAGLGLGSIWVTQEAARLDEPGLRIVRPGEPDLIVAGRWLAIRPADGLESLPVLLDDGLARFRGALLLYVNDRGSLNLVNELPLEQYLRGVVPRELGPELYPRIEALKAQTVAARTYTLHHLGEFTAEGYDICKGPRCQVYGGQSAEHPLSDRAVEETAGQVILHHDSLIDSMYSANCGGHTEDAPVVFPWMDAPYLQGVPCPEASPVTLAGAADRPAHELDLLRPEEAFFLAWDPTSRRLTVAEAEARRQGLAASREIPLADDLVTLASRGDDLSPGPLQLVPGDRLTLYRWNGRVLAVSHDEDPARLPTDQDARLHTWRRVKTDRELADRVARRYPGFRLDRLEVLSRGISGRVGRLRLVDRSGRTEVVEGLAVRWVLDLPDTRFEMRRLSGAWEFVGGGWGHGVGLCQIGAFRMAGRGASYREILGHYYSGVRLGRAVVRRPGAARPSP